MATETMAALIQIAIMLWFAITVIFFAVFLYEKDLDISPLLGVVGILPVIHLIPLLMLAAWKKNWNDLKEAVRGDEDNDKDCYCRVADTFPDNPKALPKRICAKMSAEFTDTKDGVYEVLYLHIPNSHDKISQHRYFYYDVSGEEMPFKAIEFYIDLSSVKDSTLKGGI